MISRFLLAVNLFLASASATEISIHGTRFFIGGKPFPYTGISFFNAIYNPSFNQSSPARIRWLEKFQRYGINVLRMWAQWDTGRIFVDDCSECTLYYPDGRLREANVERLKQILTDADRAGMVVELALFAGQSWAVKGRLGTAEADRAVAALTRELKPWRNLTFQIWNEFSERVLDHVKTIRANDPKRLITNSPGIAGVLGDNKQNLALDYLTPHTSRQNSGEPWDVAPKEIAYLLALYRKPVVDDEPARNGTPNHGGPNEQTWPADHILQIYKVWQLGAYINYHHDMFQTGYNSSAVPPSGVPEPEFNPYHRAVLEFIALRQRYMPPALWQ